MKSYIFALLTAVFWGAAPILGKMGLAKLPPFLALSLRSFTISAVLLVVGLLSGSFKNLHIDARSFLFIAGEGLMASLLGQLAYYYALKYSEASKVVPISSSFPLVTVALAFLFLHESMTLKKIFGTLLVILGIILIRG
ncbi:MAG: GRP family sugar transporter [Thermosediminibacteraceae bacterium]|nr:GRP family sugar transporter [Thermosediminibacteraceae bacterium]